MARYLMGDTRLGWLERMMTDPSRRSSTRSDIRKKGTRKKPPRGQSAGHWTCEKEGGV